MVFKQYLSVLPSSRVGERDAIFTSAKLVCTCLNRLLYCKFSTFLLCYIAIMFKYINIMYK